MQDFTIICWHDHVFTGPRGLWANGVLSVTPRQGEKSLLLLGYENSPDLSCAGEFQVDSAQWQSGALYPLQYYDAIIVAPRLAAAQIGSARAQAPDATIIAHLADDAPSEAIVERMQSGVDDVLFESQLADGALFLNRVLIARQRRQCAEPSRQATATDELTGLPDRGQFLAQLQGMLDQANRSRVAVMILDIQAFKSINDSLGHEVGDELLRTVGERLATLAEDGACAARIGHDHFAIGLNNIADPVTIGIYAETIVSLVRQPYSLESASQDIYITVSLGLAIEDDGANDAETMLRQANIAHSQAKEEGRPIARFEPVLAADIHYKHLLRNNLHSALANREFFLLYQPQFDMATGKLVGVESLLRWRHPSLGLIQPDLFIPLLEETGLIIETGRWIIEEVCEQLKHLTDTGRIDGSISAAINISSKQFHDAGLADFIEQAIRKTGVSPRQLKLELTESLLVVDTDLVAEKLYRLKALGISICIDDFGTGYASLSYLRQFPIDVLKIDKSFIQSIGISEQSDAIVLAIINLAHDLHFHVIAEGVETQEQRAFLTHHRCDTVQGYLYGKPSPATDVLGHNPSGNRPYISVA